MTAEWAIVRFRRGLALVNVLRVLLFVVPMMAYVGLSMIPAARSLSAFIMVFVLVSAVWIVLSLGSARRSRLAAQQPSLIAAGRYQQAEQEIEKALTSFTTLPAVKFLSLHHLALLRHAQRRWQEAAALSRALLGARLGSLQSLSRSSRLTLASSLLELGDLVGAYEAIRGLYAQRLPLNEALQLLRVQVDYEVRLGAWEYALPVGDPMPRIQMTELMTTTDSALTQALLALAALRSGRLQWATWLRERVELMTDIRQLCADRPVLWEIWSVQGSAGTSTTSLNA